VSEDGTIDRSRKLWPKTTPCAVIERASCPDQRVIRTTLEFVAAAIEEEGSRPPGLLVLGVACEVLYKSEAGRKWTVEEGLKGFEDFGSVQVGLEELVVGEKKKPEGIARGDSYGQDLKV
jgi:uroporphyrin-III C-methyltransferase